jgi:hypothetical protein
MTIKRLPPAIELAADGLPPAEMVTQRIAAKRAWPMEKTNGNSACDT